MVFSKVVLFDDYYKSTTSLESGRICKRWMQGSRFPFWNFKLTFGNDTNLWILGQCIQEQNPRLRKKKSKPVFLNSSLLCHAQIGPV